MNTRENFLAILNYREYDQMPLVHFGYWRETLLKWAEEGHISRDDAEHWRDGNAVNEKLNRLLGFDWGYTPVIGVNSGPLPPFPEETICRLPDGATHVRNGNGVILLHAPDAGGIPAEIEHLLCDRASFETHYRHRLQWLPERVDSARLEQLCNTEFDTPVGIFAGSMIGQIRDIVGVVGLSYLMLDDPGLVDEMLDIWGENSYRGIETILKSGLRVDFIHYWEDICFKNGPLVMPDFFREKIAPHYRRVSELAGRYGVDLISVDCDGMIDELIPAWLENGVNTMFPIEVGTWHASLLPWREKYGKTLRGVGGMDKRVFALDKSAVDAEIERLKPIVAAGGYIPCPDHRIAPDAKWDMVRYYCDRMRRAFC